MHAPVAGLAREYTTSRGAAWRRAGIVLLVRRHRNAVTRVTRSGTHKYGPRCVGARAEDVVNVLKQMTWAKEAGSHRQTGVADEWSWLDGRTCRIDGGSTYDRGVIRQQK